MSIMNMFSSPISAARVLSAGLCCLLSKYPDEPGGGVKRLIKLGGAADEAIGDEVIDGDGGTLFSCAETEAADESAGVESTGNDDTDGGAAVPAVPLSCPFDAFDTLGEGKPAGPFGCEFVTAAAYRIGGNAGFDPAVPGAPDGGRLAFRASDIGVAAKFAVGGIEGGFDDSSVASRYQ